MKNEALERLWRMLNIADIEDKGATRMEVSLWYKECEEAIIEMADVLDEAYERGFAEAANCN